MSRFLIMGVINVTPDSFSDGGCFTNVEHALAHAENLIRDGADLLDLGAESTRPGATPVSTEEELQRLMPVLDRLIEGIEPRRLSVDTRNEIVARAVLRSGVGFINNVNGLFDRATLTEIARSGAGYIAMHKSGEPPTMQEKPLGKKEALKSFHDFTKKVFTETNASGFRREQVFVDPGIGFGKSESANLALIADVADARGLTREFNIAIGISRKGFIGRLLDISKPEDRDLPCKTMEFMLGMAGVKIIRTHRIAELARMRAVVEAEV